MTPAVLSKVSTASLAMNSPPSNAMLFKLTRYQWLEPFFIDMYCIAEASEVDSLYVCVWYAGSPRDMVPPSLEKQSENDFVGSLPSLCSAWITACVCVRACVATAACAS